MHQRQILQPRAKRTLGPQIADYLRREILFGKLGPNDHITQETICLQFGTSRIPVRDAIQQLLHEGFLLQTNYGVRIAELSAQDLEDIFSIEGTLHALAVRLATERASDDAIQALVKINESIKTEAAAHRTDAVAELNETFHRSINKIADSKRLMSALRSASVHISGEYLALFPEDGESAFEEHDLILNAMLARDPDAAAAVMLRHVRSSAKILFSRMIRLRDTPSPSNQGVEGLRIVKSDQEPSRS